MALRPLDVVLLRAIFSEYLCHLIYSHWCGHGGWRLKPRLRVALSLNRKGRLRGLQTSERTSKARSSVVWEPAQAGFAAAGA
jgi:hypothetical protein